MADLVRLTLGLPLEKGSKTEQPTPAAEPQKTRQDVAVVVPEELLEQARVTRLMFMLFMGLIAAISLLVGGIGIMNIMLVSVTERTREIGIRMAVGAHGWNILLQFLIEAVILSCMGGVAGIALGVGASKALSVLAGWPILISPASVVAAFASSAAIGIFFGLYPARRAAALDPIEALRYE